MTSNHAVNVHAPFLAGCSDVIRHNGCGHHLPPFSPDIKYHNYHLSSLWDVFWHVCQTITNGICNNIWVFSTCFVMYVLLTLPFYDNFFIFVSRILFGGPFAGAATGAREAAGQVVQGLHVTPNERTKVRRKNELNAVVMWRWSL